MTLICSVILSAPTVYAAWPEQSQRVPWDDRVAQARSVLAEAKAIALERDRSTFELCGALGLVGDVEGALAVAQVNAKPPVAYRYAVTGIAARGDFEAAETMVRTIIQPAEPEDSLYAYQAELTREKLSLMKEAAADNNDPAHLYSLGIFRYAKPNPPKTFAPVKVDDENELKDLKPAERARRLANWAMWLSVEGDLEAAQSRFREAKGLLEGSSNPFTAQASLRDLAQAMAESGFADLSRETFEDTIKVVVGSDVEAGMAASLGMDPERAPRLGIDMNAIALKEIAVRQAASGHIDDACKTRDMLPESDRLETTQAMGYALARAGRTEQAVMLLEPLRFPGPGWHRIVRNQAQSGDIESAKVNFERLDNWSQFYVIPYIAYQWAGEDPDAALAWVRSRNGDWVRVAGMVAIAERLLGVAISEIGP